MAQGGGGNADVVARILVEALEPVLGQSIVAENNGTASGMRATDDVSNSAPDGYTLLVGTSSQLVHNMALFDPLPVDSLGARSLSGILETRAAVSAISTKRTVQSGQSSRTRHSPTAPNESDGSRVRPPSADKKINRIRRGGRRRPVRWRHFCPEWQRNSRSFQDNPIRPPSTALRIAATGAGHATFDHPHVIAATA